MMVEDKGKSRQDRSGLARIAGAGKRPGTALPHVPQRKISKTGKVTWTKPGKKGGR